MQSLIICENKGIDEQSLACIGIDEAGRGCLAGPVVASAVFFLPTFLVHSLPCKITDSKKLTEKQRLAALSAIKENAIMGVGISWPKEIDEVNILQATFIAMSRAIASLRVRCSQKNIPLPVYPLYIDGNHGIPLSRWEKSNPKLPSPLQFPIIDGDAKNIVISAASIVAKTYRDALMVKFASRYPHYDFARHKGYGTKAHVAAIQQYGSCPLHRQTFAKVKPTQCQGSLLST